MKIEKIDVKTSNKNHAIDIATLVDKSEFLREIQRLRQKWQITKLSNAKGLLGGTSLLDPRNLLYYTDIKEEQPREKHSEFNQDIENVLKMFHRGKNFKLVVIYALIVGLIPEGIYQSCYFEVATLNEKADPSKPENYQYVIVVSPRTEKKEVVDTFIALQEFIQEKIKFESRTESNLEKSGNLITDQELNELKEQAQLLQAEYIKYKEKTKNAPIDEVVDEYSLFSKRTQPMRDKYEALRHKIPLTMDNPEDVELINIFHAGNIYESAIINDGSRRDLDRTREWYWMRFGDYFNGVSDKPKTYEDVAEEWRCKCPRYPTDNDKKHDRSCMYCHVNATNFAHTLIPYEKLLT